MALERKGSLVSIHGWVKHGNFNFTAIKVTWKAIFSREQNWSSLNF